MSSWSQKLNEHERILREHIHKSFQANIFPEPWRNLPEVPSSAEINPADDDDGELSEEKWNDYQDEPAYYRKLPHNIVDGPWPSREAYLGAHYQILREDAIAPLRQAVSVFSKDPSMNDTPEIAIYTHVSNFQMPISTFC